MGKYTCALCGMSYDSAEQYANCVRDCLAAAKAEEKKKRDEKLKEEYAARVAEIESAERALIALKERFHKDYHADCRVISTAPQFGFWW